jgi:hypothetical protein
MIRRLLPLLTLIAFVITCFACSPKYQVVTPELRTNMMDDFKAGRANLGCEFNCSWSWIENFNKMATLYNNEQWERLAELVMQIGHEKDLAYYFLGCAAEGLGHQDAAIKYYQKSMYLYSDSSSVHHCRTTNCGGLDLAALLPIHLARAQKAGDQKNPDKNPLNEAVIKNLFANKLNDSGQKPELGNIKIVQGRFIDDKSICALVSFHDGSESHAAGWGKLWLLTYDNGWKLKRKIRDADNIKFKMVNIDKKIRPAVWIELGWINMGGLRDRGILLLVGTNNDVKLFEYEGYNSCGTGLKDSDFEEHQIEFKDMDGDGSLEIIDMEKRGKCNRKNYEKVSKGDRIIKSVYKFNGKKYAKTS